MAFDHRRRRDRRPQRRASTPPTSAWSTPSSRRSLWMRASGICAPWWTCPGSRVSVQQHACRCRAAGCHGQAVALLVADLPRAGRPRVASPARAAGSAPAPHPRRSRARRSRTSVRGPRAPGRPAGRAGQQPRPLCPHDPARPGPGWPCAAPPSRARRRTRPPRRRRRWRRDPWTSPAAAACATPPAPGRPPALRTPASDAGRGPRSDGGFPPAPRSRVARNGALWLPWAAPWPVAAAWSQCFALLGTSRRPQPLCDYRHDPWTIR